MFTHVLRKLEKMLIETVVGDAKEAICEEVAFAFRKSHVPCSNYVVHLGKEVQCHSCGCGESWSKYNQKVLFVGLSVCSVDSCMTILYRLLLGSVSSYCVHNCTCPVVVVRDQEE
jgi:hypothetical protein